MQLFDSHAHYNDEKFEVDREEILNKMNDSHVKKIINAGYSLVSSKQALEIAKFYDWVYVIAGISPNDVPETEGELLKQLQELEQWIMKQKELHKIVGIGEIGLDYYWRQDNKEIQKKAFIWQIELANRLQLPIIIHTREAVQDTITILKSQKPVNESGIFHCCPFNRELVKEALKLDFYISFAGPVTFKNAKNAEEIVKMVPFDRILIETDSPYLSPEPHRGKRNDSRNIKYIAEKIAFYKEKSLEEIGDITYQNACKIFKIEN